LNRIIPLTIFFIFLLALLLFGGPKAFSSHVTPAIDNLTPDYAREIQPLLHDKCGGCHGKNSPKADLSVMTRADLLKGGKSGPAIIPGSSASSLLLFRVTGEKPPQMPLGGKPLSPGEIAILRTWIDSGAVWNEPASSKWAPTLAPHRPTVPETGTPQLQHPVDRFIAEYFKQHQLTFPAPVNDALFVRRVYLDIWGLLPTPAQLQEFLRDPSQNKREHLIDQLLAHSKNYSEQWISLWNDFLRNDEGVVYHGVRKSITPWLLKALEDNLPYDRFVSALLNPAGPDGPEGFLMGVNWRGEVSASQTPPMQAAQNSAQVFLGINLKCASCHDSFINQWKLRDSYGLAGFFSEKPLELVRCDVKLGEVSKTKFVYPELGTVETDAPLAVRRAAAAQLMTKPENGRFARTLVNRYWKKLFGRGLVEPVDDMDVQPWDAELLDWLASDFVEHQYDLKFLIRRIMTSQTYQLPAVRIEGRGEKQYIFKGPYLRRLTAEEFVDAASSITGEWRVVTPQEGGTGNFARDWRLKSSSLTRALGRPIRDQVFTTRSEDATTLQSLELVNGEDFSGILRHGALNLLNQRTIPPSNLFDSGIITKKKEIVDIDISEVTQLWLLTVDSGSYNRNLVSTGWADGILSGPGGERRLQDLKSETSFKQGNLRLEGQEFSNALIGTFSSELVFDLPAGQYTRMRAIVGVDDGSQHDDVSPRVRFFVFSQKPDPDRLVKVSGNPPVPFRPGKYTADSLTQYLYRYALSREPSEKEKVLAREFLLLPPDSKKISIDGLEDLLWAILMTPEFQFIR
jgi:hypothetical protein